MFAANISVLDWWFKDKDTHLLLHDESLQCDVMLVNDGRQWRIDVKGDGQRVLV